MIKTRSDALLVWQVNTAAAGGSAVTITNSSNLFITNTNLSVILQNSGGLFANQSGTWNVGITNSAGWIFAQSNTATGINILNSGGIFSNQSGTWTVGISNSAGWVFAQSNTGGVVTIANTGGTVLSPTIANTAGWVVAQSNTGGNVNIANSAGWAIFEIDSAAIGAVVTQVASTIGAVTLAVSNTKRVAFSLYNASANPLFMKLGASASTASYTLMMVASGYYELARPIYNGIITGIWQTANGFAYVSETT